MQSCENTETAESYDFWSAAWVLSNVIGRRLTVARPYAPVFLNLYTILCAEAGITRKSSAVRTGTNLLRQYMDAAEDQRQMRLLTGSITTEQLDVVLARQTTLWGHGQVALSSSELVSLLGRDRAAANLPGKLTDLYDCPSTHSRASVAQGERMARDVYITLLAASTPSWLIRAVNPDVVEGGFTSRCLFIIEDSPKQLVAWPEEVDNASISARLIEQLSTLRREADYVRQRAGGIRLTAVAKRAFTEWYQGRRIHGDAYGASFQAREDHHILRLAGLLAVSDGRWEIDEHHIANATAAIQHIKLSGLSLFGSGVAASKTYALVDRIRGALVSAGRSGLSQSALTGVCRKFGTRAEQEAIMLVMHEMGLVQRFSVEHDGPGKPTTMYRATKAMTNHKALEDVVDLLVPQEVL